MKSLILLSLLFCVTAQAQNSSELTCRAKAKEIAAQTYSSCITDARTSQIDQIRKDYQKQLAELKAKYDKELKKVGGKSVSVAGPSAEAKSSSIKNPVVTSTAAPKPTKGVAKSLPTRKETKSAPAPVETQESMAAPESVTPAPEDGSSQNDAQGDLSIRLVPAQGARDSASANSAEPVY